MLHFVSFTFINCYAIVVIWCKARSYYYLLGYPFIQCLCVQFIVPVDDGRLYCCCIMSSPVYGVACCKLQVAGCKLPQRAGHNSLSRICLIKSHSAEAQQKVVMGNYLVIDLLSLHCTLLSPTALYVSLPFSIKGSKELYVAKL